MKRIGCLFFITFFINVAANAQDETVQSKSAKFVYCQLLETRKFFTNKVTITVDFGDEPITWKRNRLKDEVTGKVKLFNSIIDALNYMGEDGWELVQTYPITFTKEENNYYWVLKKRKE